MGDDGSMLTISGGVNILNSGGDGLDSNGSMTITGATTIVSGPTSGGNGSLDVNGTFTMTDGSLVAAGSSGMAEAPTTSGESGFVQVNFTTAVAAGATISIVSGDSVIASFTTVKEVQNIVLASAELTDGQSYDVYLGGSLGDDTVGTYSAGGSIEGATKAGSVTAGVATGGQRG